MIAKKIAEHGTEKMAGVNRKKDSRKKTGEKIAENDREKIAKK